MFRYLYLMFFCLLNRQSIAQEVSMSFPAFAGKTYDFIIFQGDKPITAQQDTIPKDGKFTLTIPQAYAPYTGMCRWLITGTTQGGGLDMAVPGYNFSVACLSDKPDNTNIVYKGFDAVNELNRLNDLQKVIIDKFEVLNKASQLYDKSHPLYASFQKEKEHQAKAYIDFQKDLKKNTNFNARFLPIVNLTRGIAPKLYEKEEDKLKSIANYIAYEADIDALYTSGHWSGIISTFLQLHQGFIKDDKIFNTQFAALTKRMSNKNYYTDFTGRLTYYMKTYGMDKQIELIAPIVVNSGKITEYVGTMEVYIKALTGSQGADLIFTEHIVNLADHNHKSTILKSSELAMGNYTHTLLVFYQSGCGPCEALMQTMPGKYPMLKEKGIRFISISADESEQVFKNSSGSYPWVDKYCDFKGKNGINFKNYAVKGTPTLVLLDKKGVIVQKAATLEEILKFQKIEN